MVTILKKLKTPAIHLTLILVVIWTIVPVLWVIGTSLSPEPHTMPTNIFPSNPRFSNFTDVLTGTGEAKGAEVFLWLKNSLIVSIGTVALSLLLAGTAAYAFSRFNFFGKSPLMFTFLLVQMFPGVLIIIPYFILLTRIGLYDTYLGLILAYTVTALPLCVWMLKTFFDGIPKDLDEAALTEGCTHFQVFRRIVLPLALPGIGVVALFAFLVGWTDFLLAYLFMTTPHYTVAVGLFMLLGQWKAYAYFAALAIIAALPVVILFIAFQRTLISGMVAGAVKR
jgi:arabinogalactan oligomer/maltooligosaccharide transport system permease protein